ncbi:MAG: lipid II:glycine glycyltransferase FemX, partial [Anaerolineales bacterium]
QFRNTVLVDLSKSEDELLSCMKQKTRYNIRLAGRRGVTIRQGSEIDLDLAYKMYLETSIRDEFVIRSEMYYRTLWDKFMKEGLAKLLLAEFEGQPLGGLILFVFGKFAWYFYGMSNQQHIDKMPNYLLQWEAMRLAKNMGCQVYDMWGAPEIFNSTDGMWGVYRFKSGFGGTVVHTPGAFDYAPRKGIYILFNRILPRLLGIMRSRRLNQAQQELG